MVKDRKISGLEKTARSLTASRHQRRGDERRDEGIIFSRVQENVDLSVVDVALSWRRVCAVLNNMVTTPYAVLQFMLHRVTLCKVQVRVNSCVLFMVWAS